MNLQNLGYCYVKHSVRLLMLCPLNAFDINAFLHHLPQRTKRKKDTSLGIQMIISHTSFASISWLSWHIFQQYSQFPLQLWIVQYQIYFKFDKIADINTNYSLYHAMLWQILAKIKWTWWTKQFIPRVNIPYPCPVLLSPPLPYSETIY